MVMKARGTRKVRTKKTNYMSDEAFADLKQALEGPLLMSVVVVAS